jgi:PAS domain S-box-containing protein
VAAGKTRSRASESIRGEGSSPAAGGRSDQRLKALLLDRAVDAIHLHDHTGALIYANDEACRAKGYTRQELMTITLQRMVTPEYADLVQQRTAQVLRDGAAVFESAHLCKDGSVLPVEVHATVIRDDGRDYVLSVARDITRRKQAEKQLQQTLAELRRSNRDLEQFAYVASHDLQEPLRMISSFTSLLERRFHGQMGQEADEFIDYIVDGSSRLQRLINDLLAYSRVDRRGRPFAETDCGAVLQMAISNLRLAIEEAGARITHTPLPRVVGDTSQLVLLFQNLLSNAIKYHGEQAPLVSVACERQGQDHLITVRDNGIGIGPRYHDRIFLIFQRLHPRGHYSGTGIGLALCKRIVERHGGRIWVESEEGRGAAFIFTLPVIG